MRYGACGAVARTRARTGGAGRPCLPRRAASRRATGEARDRARVAAAVIGFERLARHVRALPRERHDDRVERPSSGDAAQRVPRTAPPHARPRRARRALPPACSSDASRCSAASRAPPGPALTTRRSGERATAARPPAIRRVAVIAAGQARMVEHEREPDDRHVRRAAPLRALPASRQPGARDGSSSDVAGAGARSSRPRTRRRAPTAPPCRTVSAGADA